MPKYMVVPQYVVDAAGPRLSSNEHLGRSIAEQIARDENGGTLFQKMAAGTALTAQEKASLPPLLRGHSWDDIAAEVKIAASKV